MTLWWHWSRRLCSFSRQYDRRIDDQRRRRLRAFNLLQISLWISRFTNLKLRRVLFWNIWRSTDAVKLIIRDWRGLVDLCLLLVDMTLLLVLCCESFGILLILYLLHVCFSFVSILYVFTDIMNRFLILKGLLLHFLWNSLTTWLLRLALGWKIRWL